MPISERAKQFSPFAAVSGLDKALAETEKAMMKEEKRELSEDETEKVNKILLRLKKGDEARVEYYFDGEYLTAEGVVSFIDKVNGIMRIGESAIGFDEICGIKNLFSNPDLL